MSAMAMNIDSYLQQRTLPAFAYQNQFGVDHIDALPDAPPGLGFPKPVEQSQSGRRSGSKNSIGNAASLESMPPGVWSFTSDVSTAASSPPRRMPPGLQRTGSNTSTAPSTPQERAPNEQSQQFYTELLRKTSQLLQSTDEDSILQCMSSPYADGLETAPYHYENVSPSRSPVRKYSTQTRYSLPLSELVVLENSAHYSEANASSTPGSVSPTRGRSPKKGRKGSKSLPMDASELDGLPSRGSKNHGKGQCRPCKNFNTANGCASGILCNFCHCDHPECKVGEPCCQEPLKVGQKGCAPKHARMSIPDAHFFEMIDFRPPPGLPPPGLA
mmetsp:Transcript_5453/g.8876  ORF Transcript_5453/g.8876 Transcript_5453/m.8876 type:complete len:329 (+) Transcript_5453:89-1075(+)